MDGVTRFLLQAGAHLIVIACNTASAAALYWLRARFSNVPFVGMEPAIKPAAEHTRSGHVGVIATAATFQGQLFASLLDRYAGGVTIHTQVCPELVPLVEAGNLKSERTRRAVHAYLAPLLEQNIDHLVLGCTHYPFLRSLIEEVAGPRVTVVDPAPAVARQTGRVLAQHGWLATGDTPVRHCFYTTGDPARFSVALRELLGREEPVQPARWVAEGTVAAAPCA
jgi:glutamate racemase